MWASKKQPLILMVKPKPNRKEKKRKVPIIADENFNLGANYIENKANGKAGEELVFEYEINKLKLLGRNNDIKKVKRKGFGCDIISYNKNREKIFIEVKTTKFSSDKPFLMTLNEYGVMETKYPNYKIYRLYDFNKKNKTAKFYIIEDNVKKQLNFISSQYEVTLK